MRWFFFQTKENWKYLNINKYKLANNQTTNFILNETQLGFYMTEDTKKLMNVSNFGEPYFFPP